MDSIVIGVIITYFAILFIASFLYKKTREMEEFSTAKRTLFAPVLMVGLVMTHYGAGFILGGAELGYQYGFQGLVYSGGAALGILLLGFFISRRLFKTASKKNIKTIPELLLQTYRDSRLALFATILSIIALMTIVAAQFFALIGIIESLQLPKILIAGALALLVGIGASKGIGAVVKLSTLHLSIIALGTFFTLWFTSTAMSSLLKSIIVFDKLSPLAFFNILLPTALYTLIGQDFYQKIFSAKDFKSVRASCVYAALVLIVVGAIPVLLGMKTRELVNVNAAAALPSLILSLLPPLLQGILIAAILAAVLGSTQALISATLSHIAEDILKVRTSFSKHHRQILLLGAAFILPFLALALTLFSNRGIVGILTMGYTIYTAGMFIPVLLCFYGNRRRMLGKYIFFSSMLGVVVALLIECRFFSFPLPAIIPAIALEGIFLFVVTYKRLHKKGL